MKSLKEIVLQLRSCGFTCEAGPLENNVDFQLLEKLAGLHEIGVPTSNPPLSHPQDIRDDIIEKAKRDEAELKPLFVGAYCIDYAVNKEKRTVVALNRSIASGRVHGRGIAKCDPSDCFNVHIGKAIALRRALGLEVPAEYLNAPQPTAVKSGDIIRLKNGNLYKCQFNHSSVGKGEAFYDDSRE